MWSKQKLEKHVEEQACYVSANDIGTHSGQPAREWEAME